MNNLRNLSTAVLLCGFLASSVASPAKPAQKDEAPNNIKIEVRKINIPIERMDVNLMVKDRIYIFSRKNWQIYEYEPLRNSFKSVAKVTPMDVPPSDFKFALVMNMDEKYFILGGTKEMRVIKKDNRKEYIIKDLPSESVNAVAAMDGRIYAFTGRNGRGNNEPPQETILFSCLPDGTDRKIHISTVRSDKSTFFDKQKPFCVTFLAGDTKKKRLLFLAARPVDGLYEFNPETGEEKKLIELKYSHSPWGMQIDSLLYVAGGGGSNDFCYTFDMETDKDDFIFYNRSDTKNLKTKPIAASDFSANTPFFTKNEQLWFSGYKITYAELSNINDYSQPTGINGLSSHSQLYPYPGDNSVLLITANDIYRLTPNKYKGKR